MDEPFGRRLPAVVVPPPGPRSRELARRLSAVESRNITPAGDPPPIAWTEAAGSNVRDADGNVYIDLTAGFSVAATGHARPEVAAAIAEQAARLPHALGDVHPPEIRARLLERLAELAPGDLRVSILASAGAEAVEAALKTAVMRTGRPGIIAFEGAYHGLTYGALAATHRREFRAPFLAQLHAVRFAPYPEDDAAAGAALDGVERELAAAADEGMPVGAVIIEPIQGRGGIIPAPHAFLHGLRDICTGAGVVLIFDEVYTGFGRTGRWFASEHAGVVPDIMTVGKALTGALPLSAAIGTPEVMAAWPPSTGEAIHTSTFLGNPVSCAAALAQLDVLERDGLVERAARLGGTTRARLDGWVGSVPGVAAIRGAGLVLGIVLHDDDGRPATARAHAVVAGALRDGVLLLAEGPDANVLALTPPLVITEAQMDHALDILERRLATTA